MYRGETELKICNTVITLNFDAMWKLNVYLHADAVLTGIIIDQILFCFNFRMLYFRLSSKKVRDTNWDRADNDHCAGSDCPKFVIYMKEQLSYSPCFEVTEDQVNSPFSKLFKTI